MTYTSRYLVPLSLTLGACLWACGSSNDIPETTGDGDGDMVGDGDASGGLSGDGDNPASGGATGDGDNPASGGATGDGDAPTTGGATGDGDGDAPTTGGATGDGDGDAPGAGGMVAMGDPAGESCALGTNYSLGEMRILNNQWSLAQPDQCIFINADRSFGWSWDNSGDFGSENPNYPEVEFGINPWGRQQDPWEVLPSSTTLLPIRLGDLTQASMTIDVSTTLTSPGKWNLAFELWLSAIDPTTQETTPTGELMVFLGYSPNYWPTEQDDAYDGTQMGEYTRAQFETEWPSSGGYAYIQWRKAGAESGNNGSFNDTLDIKQFLDHALQANEFDPNWYITRFEIGNEVYTGAVGETTINSLSFSVNGQSRSAL